VAPATKRASVRKPTHLRREEIADVALRILATEGQRRFTSKYLAAQVGITEGAIFRHFDSMEAIADAIVERMGEALSPSFATAATDPLERLHGFFQRRAAVFQEMPELARLLLSDHLGQAAGPDHAERVNDLRRRSQRFVLECLTQAKAQKTLATGFSTEAALRLVMGAMMSLGHGGPLPGPPVKRSAAIEELWALLERALRGKEPAR
jgi:TetR/AcrR family transcriptional regulator